MSHTAVEIPGALFVGLTTVDLVQHVPAAVRPGEKVVSSRADLSAGGPAANAAVAFAALGGSAVLLTGLGNGPLARVARADLAAYDVHVADAGGDGHEVAVSAVTVVESTGERSVVSRNAEGAELTAPVTLPGMVDEAVVVLVDGHHPGLCLAAAAAARAADVPVVLDAGSWKPVLNELLPLCDVVICSSAFALPGGGEPLALVESGVPLVAVTAGAAPVRWRTPQASGEVPVPQVRAVDTLGAGDVLHGAFAYAWACGLREPSDALAYAATVASVRVTRRGSRTWTSAALPHLPGVS